MIIVLTVFSVGSVPLRAVADSSKPANLVAVPTSLQTKPDDSTIIIEESQQLSSDRGALQATRELSNAVGTGDVVTIRDQVARLAEVDPGIVVPREAGLWEPLYRHVFRLIHQANDGVLQQIRKESSATADREMNQLLAAGEFRSLTKIILRYPGTEASYRVHLLLASLHRDRGHLMAARYWLQSLSDCVRDPRWLKAVNQMENQLDELLRVSGKWSSEKAVTDLAGESRTVAEAGSGAESATIDDPSGASADSASSSDSAPTSVTEWTHQLPMSPATRSIMHLVVSSAVESQVFPTTEWSAIVGPDSICFRTVRGLTSLDLSTGKPRWSWTARQNLEMPLTATDRRSDETPAPPGAAAANRLAMYDHSPVSDLLLRNALVGKLSADDERIYLVQHAGQRDQSRASMPVLRGEGVAEASTELVAISRDSGRRIWICGGRPVEEIFRNELTSAWFAGPPVVSGRDLYGICEQLDGTSRNAIVSLVCLRADSGSLQWKLPLSYPSVSAAMDQPRQLRSAVGTVNGGLLWIDTTTGWMSCLDPILRCPIWLKRIDRARSAATDENSAVPGNPGRERLPVAPSLREFRGSAAPVPSGNHLLMFPDDPRTAIIVNSLTGQTLHQITTPAPMAVLHTDSEHFICSSGQEIQCFNCRDASQLWKTILPEAGRQPSGRGILQGSRFLVPMSDNTVQCIRMNDGGLDQILPVKFNSEAWGHLLTDGRQIFRSSPEQIQRLSQDPSNSARGTAVDKVSQLMNSGNYEEALKQAGEQTVGGTTPSEDLRLLKFQCLAAISQKCSVDDLNEVWKALDQLARSDRDRALIQRLQISRVILDGDISVAAEQIVSLLAENGHLLNQELLPETLSVPSQDQNAVVVHGAAPLTVSQPFRSWLHSQLQTLLDQHGIGGNAVAGDTASGAAADSAESSETAAEPMPRDQFPIRVLERLPDQSLLWLFHAAVQNEMIRRVESRLGERNHQESTLQLIQEIILNDPERTDLLQQLADQMIVVENQSEAVSTPDSGDLERRRSRSEFEGSRQIHRSLLQRLFSSLHAELRDRGVGFHRMGEDIVAAQPQDAKSDWSQWERVSLKSVPVSQSVSFRPTEQLLTESIDGDAVLAGYQWQLLRNPAMLKVQPLSTGHQGSWTVSGQFSDTVQSGYPRDTVHRCGSMILIQTPQSLSAVSILDQKVLWTKQLQGHAIILSSEHPMRRRLIREMSRGINSGNGVYPTAARLCGATRRWVCIQDQERLEVVDLLTGMRVWSIESDLTQRVIVATDDAVLIDGSEEPNASVSAFRIADGTSVATSITSDQLRRTLTSVGSHLVIAGSAGAGSGNAISQTSEFPGTLEWVMPFSETKRKPFVSRGQLSVELPGTRTLQRADQQTFVAIGEDCFYDVLLHRGVVQQFALPAELLPGTETRSENGQDREKDIPEAGAGAQSHPVVVFRDAENFYLTRTPMEQKASGTRFHGRDLIPITGVLVALSRETGEPRWKVELPDEVLATFDQPQSPILLLIRTEQHALNQPRVPGVFLQAGIPRLSFQGILKTNGRRLLEHRLSARYPVPFLRMMTKGSDTVDIEVYGARVRFLPE